MTARASPLQVLAGALLALGLASCAELSLTQAREEALVRIGETRRLVPAADHADLYLDYALIAEQTYADSLYETRRPFDIGPFTYCIERTRDGEPCADRRGLTGYATARLRRWRRIYAEKGFERLGCPPARSDCAGALGGLGVQIWVRRGRVCSEAVIAFRGTDGASADDWASNLRWVLRLLPFYDQYDQVQDFAPGFVRAVEREPCFRRGTTRIVALGHSLGGGLAHQAAYREGAFVHVYAFDPSVVTGYYDLPPDLREANARGLPIDRVYERGEILAYPRFILAQLSPPSACDPEIRTVRLRTIEGDPIRRHNLNSMTTALLDWSKARREAGLPADLPLPRPSPDTCRSKDPGPRPATRPAGGGPA